MTQEQIQTAYNILTRQGAPGASTYLSSIGKTLCDFADVLKVEKNINDDMYFKICGKYPPPPPDPQREKAYSDWANALSMGQLNIHQVFGSYPYADDTRYLQDATNWARTKLNGNALSDGDIKILYQKGIFVEAEIQSAFNNIGRAQDVNTVLGKPKAMVSVVLPTETQMLPDRNDVLLIGNRAAGKTMFLASFLHYLQEQIGGVRILGEVMGSFDYSQKLIAAIAQNKLIDRTIGGTCTNIPIDIRRERQTRRRTETFLYPLNLTDISGETYQDSLDQGIESLPSNLRSITFSLDNPKILLFTIPVGEYIIQWNKRVQAADGSITNTMSEMLIAGFYSNVLNMLERHDVLRKTIGVGLIVTKWDKAEAEGFTSVQEFVETKCATLHQTILDLQSRDGNQYAYQVFNYSISDNIDEAINSYVYNPIGNEEIYEWLTNTAYQAG